MDNNIKDIVIIGAGCAGITAAIYALQAGKGVLILENNAVGGQISTAGRIENYPAAFGITGSEFSDRLFNQATELGAEIMLCTATAVREGENKKIIETDCGAFFARAVIIASGCVPRKLGAKNEDKFTGHGVSYCALCDGGFYKGKKVAVVGGGEAAVQFTDYLCEICESVVLIHRRGELRATSENARSIASKHKNLELKLCSSVISFDGDKKLKSITVKNNEKGKTEEILLDGVFVAAGHIPSNEPFKDVAKLSADGYIVTNDDMETGIKGVFAAGDCRQKSVRQLTTAAADGTVAAVSACLYLQEPDSQRTTFR